MRTGLLLLLALGALLYVSNPSPAELREKLVSLMKAQIDKEAVGQGGEGAGEFGKILVPVIVNTITIERRDFLFFSLFRIGLPQVEGTPLPRCMLGVAKQFVALDNC